jgi:hypothetical protein
MTSYILTNQNQKVVKMAPLLVHISIFSTTDLNQENGIL